MLTTSELERLSARAPHGSHARYNAHRLAGEEACDPCRAAECAYRAELRAGRSRSSSRNARGPVSVFEGEAAEQLLAELRREGIDVPELELDEEDDDDGDERSWADDLESVEDETDAAERSLASMIRGWELFGQQVESLFGSRMAAAPTNGPRTTTASMVGRQPTRSHRRSTVGNQPASSSSRSRVATSSLRAITTELDETRPRGRRAVELLVEAAQLLRGGVTMLAQYGQTRGCDPDDVAEAERAIAGRQKRR